MRVRLALRTIALSAFFVFFGCSEKKKVVEVEWIRYEVFDLAYTDGLASITQWSKCRAFADDGTSVWTGEETRIGVVIDAKWSMDLNSGQNPNAYIRERQKLSNCKLPPTRSPERRLWVQYQPHPFGESLEIDRAIQGKE